MYTKTDLFINAQEFSVKNYSIEEFNERYEKSLSSYEEIIGPPMQCLLPETKFYIHCGKKKLKKLPQNETGIYDIILHPKAMNVESREPIILSLYIDFSDWCIPGQMLLFPIVSVYDQRILDPFKTKKILDERGLPGFIQKKQDANLQMRKNAALMAMSGPKLKESEIAEALRAK